MKDLHLHAQRCVEKLLQLDAYTVVNPHVHMWTPDNGLLLVDCDSHAEATRLMLGAAPGSRAVIVEEQLFAIPSLDKLTWHKVNRALRSGQIYDPSLVYRAVVTQGLQWPYDRWEAKILMGAQGERELSAWKPVGA